MAIGVGALLVLYFGFKATKFAAKAFLFLIALALLAGAGWWYFVGHAR
jgi:hypothetical protein